MRVIGLTVVLAVGIALGLALAPLVGEAQQTTKVTPIGYLSGPRAACSVPRARKTTRRAARSVVCGTPSGTWTAVQIHRRRTVRACCRALEATGACAVI
jgi:hypothetical protein